MTDRYAAYTRLDLDYPAARVLRITFNHPETYNSVDAETHTQLTHIWRDIDDDPDISAVIVTGAGKAFSAGGDFQMIEQLLKDETAHGHLERGPRPGLQRDQLQQTDCLGD